MCGLGAGAFGRNGPAPLGIDQKVDLFRDGNLGTNRHADCVAQCPLSGATRKHLLLASISPFDPDRTFGPINPHFLPGR
jgi:hypothetical protein